MAKPKFLLILKTVILLLKVTWLDTTPDCGRVFYFMQNGTPENWTGVLEMRTK